MEIGNGLEMIGKFVLQEPTKCETEELLLRRRLVVMVKLSTLSLSAWSELADRGPMGLVPKQRRKRPPRFV